MTQPIQVLPLPPFLDIFEFAKLIKSTPQAIRSTRNLRPQSLPPVLPGSRRKLLWDTTAVLAWYRGENKKRRGAPTKAERVAKKASGV